MATKLLDEFSRSKQEHSNVKYLPEQTVKTKTTTISKRLQSSWAITAIKSKNVVDFSRNAQYAVILTFNGNKCELILFANLILGSNFK